MSQTQARYSSFPPMRIQRSTRLSVRDAQPIFAKFLERTKTKPYLHPDASLATDGVKLGAKGGPNGGWAIHHLKRIEAGMRGVSLMPESREELVAQFGDEALQHGVTTSDPNQVGDDTAVDDTIAGAESHLVEDEIDLTGKSGKDLTREEKKARKEAKKKRRQEQMADGERAQKRKKNGVDTMDLDNNPDAQSKESYEREQEIVVGEVGERDTGASSKQNVPPPAVVTHDEDGEVAVTNKARTVEEKAGRKATKKAKRKELRADRVEASKPSAENSELAESSD